MAVLGDLESKVQRDWYIQTLKHLKEGIASALGAYYPNIAIDSLLKQLKAVTAAQGGHIKRRI